MQRQGQIIHSEVMALLHYVEIITPTLLTKSFTFSSTGVGCSNQSQPSTSTVSLPNNISYSSNLSMNSCQVPFISTSVTNVGPNSASSGSVVAKLAQEERWDGDNPGQSCGFYE